jgi:D-xylose transport system substrate-binding protein
MSATNIKPPNKQNVTIRSVKFVFFSVCIVVILGFISCSNGNGKVKIGYLNWNGANEIARKTLTSFKEKATQLGIEVVDKDAHNDDKKQLAQANELINQGVKVLVIKPVNTILGAEIVRYAHKKGIVVIANDQLIRNCPLDFYVTFDSEKVGEFMALEALKYKPIGTYVFFGGDKVDDNADLVKSGVYKILQPHINNGNIKMLYSNYIEAWSQENAEHEMEMILRLSQVQSIDAVIASCDDMARGAINILEKQNLLGNTFVSGQNADIQSLKLILIGKQTITLAKSPKTLGYAMAELAAKIATHSNKKLETDINASTYNGYKNVPSILFNPVIVDKANVEKIMKND